MGLNTISRRLSARKLYSDIPIPLTGFSAFSLCERHLVPTCQDDIPSRHAQLSSSILSPDPSLSHHQDNDEIFITPQTKSQLYIQTGKESSHCYGHNWHLHPGRSFNTDGRYSRYHQGKARTRRDTDAQNLPRRHGDMLEIPHRQGARGRSTAQRSGSTGEGRGHRDAEHSHRWCNAGRTRGQDGH